MRKGILILALSLFALIIISGCTGQNVNVSFTNGVVINEFSVDPDIVQPDDTVTFFLDIENQGSVTASSVGAYIYGVESWYDVYGTPLSSPYGSSLFIGATDQSIELCWQGSGGNRICGGYDWGRDSGYLDVAWGNIRIAYNSFYHDIFSYPTGAWGDITLLPPYPERNKPGQFRTKQWTFRPPVLPEGVRATYPITARVYFDYKTTGSLVVRAFNSEEYQRRIDKGEVTLLSHELSNSNAPIQLNLIKATSPIIVNEKRPGTPEIINFLLEFNNVGDGWPLTFSSLAGEETGLMLGQITVTGPGVTFYDCIGQGGGNVIFVDPYVYAEVNILKLRSDGRLPFGCSVAIDRTEWLNRPLGTITMTFDFRYMYYVDKEVSVVVVGQEGF